MVAWKNIPLRMDEKLLNRNKNINRGFRNLEIWQIAIKIYKLVHEILSEKRKISFKIKAQILDSALSISSNIAEGYARRTIKENLRFYEIALASAAENYSQMFALHTSGQLKDDDFNNYDSHLYRLENKIIKMNISLIEKMKSSEEWKTDYE